LENEKRSSPVAAISSLPPLRRGFLFISQFLCLTSELLGDPVPLYARSAEKR
jgi:hypothetical protein